MLFNPFISQLKKPGIAPAIVNNYFYFLHMLTLTNILQVQFPVPIAGKTW
jgi:hypothetical protein